MLGSRQWFIPQRFPAKCYASLPRSTELSRGKSTVSEESSHPLSVKPILEWRTGAASAVAFMAVAIDVFHPSSLGLLKAIDTQLHLHSLTLDPTVSQYFLKEVSDVAIICGWLGWLAVTLAHLSQLPALFQCDDPTKGDKEAYLRATIVLVISWIFFTMIAGDHQPWLVGTLKDFFSRSRPSPVLASFSFPSGHTAASTFLWLNLMTVLLPTMVPRLSDDCRKLALPVLLASYACTATGRIMGDAHWFSDTLASLFLTLTVVSFINEAASCVLKERP